jgi:hypothetical protein
LWQLLAWQLGLLLGVAKLCMTCLRSCWRGLLVLPLLSGLCGLVSAAQYESWH